MGARLVEFPLSISSKPPARNLAEYKTGCFHRVVLRLFKSKEAYRVRLAFLRAHDGLSAYGSARGLG